MIGRIKRVIILARCLGRAFLRGGSKESVVARNKIVIVQLAKLGDMVCTTPMFRAVKLAYPESKLTVVGDAINEKLLKGNKDVDQYLVWDESIIHRIERENFDFGCVTTPSFEGLSALFLSGIPLISAPIVLNGWSSYETIPYKILRKFVILSPHRMGTYAPREYLRLLEPVGIHAENTDKHLNYSKEAGESVEKYLSLNSIKKDKILAGIIVSAGNKIKEWPLDRFAKVSDHLSKKYEAEVIIIGGPKDGELVSRTLELISPGAKVLGTTTFSIEELKALISKLSLLVAVDTGPVYIAEAFGIPTIDIVGPMDEREQPPISAINKVVVPQGRAKPELHIMNARSYDEARAIEQVLSISASQVIDVLDNLLEKIIVNPHQ